MKKNSPLLTRFCPRIINPMSPFAETFFHMARWADKMNRLSIPMTPGIASMGMKATILVSKLKTTGPAISFAHCKAAGTVPMTGIDMEAGTGLGLAAAPKIAAIHQGTIRAGYESGSVCLRIDLPFAEPA